MIVSTGYRLKQLLLDKIDINTLKPKQSGGHHFQIIIFFILIEFSFKFVPKCLPCDRQLFTHS